MNRAERRALAKRQRHHGRVTGEPPKVRVQHIAPDGTVVKDEIITGEPAGQMIEEQRRDPEWERRQEALARAAKLGLWTPGMPV